MIPNLVKGSRSGMGRGPTQEDPVQVAVLGCYARGAGGWNVHFYSLVLCVRGRGNRLYLRGLAKRTQRPSTETQRGHRNRYDRHFRFATLATAAIYGLAGSHKRRENGRFQERNRRRQEAERYPREAGQCQGL